MSETVFYIFSCFFHDDIDSNTTGIVWFRVSDYKNPSKGVQINLSRCPNQVENRVLKWSEVEVDDHRAIDLRGETTVGPSFPPGYGKREGTLALSQQFHASIPADRRPSLPPDMLEGKCREYEFIAVQYWDKPDDVPNDRRFRGFHARRETDQIMIWNPGYSLVNPPAVSVPLARFRWDLCDPVENKHSAVGATSAEAEGALFIDVTYARTELGLMSPKLPIGLGKFAVQLKQRTTDLAYVRELGRKITWSFEQFAFVADRVLAQMASRQDLRASRYSFDIIGHSKGEDSLLEIWDGRLLDAQVVRELAPFFQSPEFRSLNVSCIRLLGCATAQSARGKAAIVALAEVAGCPVYGTVSRIGTEHFDQDGFRREADAMTVDDRVLRRQDRNFSGALIQASLVATMPSNWDERWFEDSTAGEGARLGSPLLAAADVVLRRVDGSLHSEIFYRSKTLFYYPAGAASPCAEYALKPSIHRPTDMGLELF